ncbi:MAG: GEVED domain-containing protein [bacterium]|nr:GEVED domain-containing protein [bacterium]
MKISLSRPRFSALRIAFFVLLFSIAAGFNNEAKAQYCTAATSNSTIIPGGSVLTTSVYVSGAPAFNFSASAGCTYWFSTCGQSNFLDTYLYLHANGTGGAVLAFSDDFCGAESQISWICPSNGVYSILITEFPCGALTSSCAVAYSVSCPPACAGTPNTGTAAISTTVGCPSINFNLSATGISTGLLGLNYQWQSSSSATGPWSSVAGGTTSSFATSTPTTTYYQLLTSCSNSSLSAASTVVTYSVVNPGPCVCNAYGASNASSTFDEEIYLVTFGTLNNPSTCTTTAPGPGSLLQRYSNYAGFVAAPNICKGVPSAFTTSINTCNSWYGMAYNVYIDYNQNGSFADAGELVVSVPYGSAIQGLNSASIIVPLTALNGTTRMRVMAVEGSISGPTGVYGYGETEDYCITILPPPTISLSATSGSICPGGSFTVSASGANTYTFVGGSGPISGTTVTLSPIVNTTYTATGTGTNGCVASGSLGTTATVITLTSPNLTIVPTPTAVCIGFSSSLTASGANTYTWTGLTTGSQVVVSPTATTIYTVTGTGTTVCNGVKNVTLVVNPLPTLTVNSGTICVGQAFTLVPTGAATYSYTGGSNTVSPAAGVASYSVTGTSTFGCLSSNTAVATVTAFALPVVTASSGTMCTGASYSIQTSGAVTYSVVGSPNPVSPTVTTTYSVIGSNSLGCVSLPAASNVTVFALPTLSITATPAPAICNTATVNLSAAGAVTYTWNNTTPGVSITQTPSVTTNNFVIGTDANGCNNAAVLQVTVNPLPNVNVTSNTNFICVGATATLNALGSGNYTWSPGASTVNPLPVNPTVSTVFSVTSSNSFGCVKTATVAVSVNTIVMTVSSNTSVCQGNTVGINVSGVISQQWSNGSGFSQISVSPSVITTYSVTGVDSKNCSHSGAVTVSVLANPVVNALVSPTVICKGESATLTASGASTYSWEATGSGASLTVSPISTGTLNYVVSGVAGNGCSSNDTTSLIVEKCVGLNELTGGLIGVSVYPNPHSGEFTIELNNGLNKSIEVTDISGRVILSEQSVSDKTIVNLKAFANGVYYVKITSGKDSEVVRVVKQ